MDVSLLSAGIVCTLGKGLEENKQTRDVVLKTGENALQ